jgi:hypothetical protein
MDMTAVKLQKLGAWADQSDQIDQFDQWPDCGYDGFNRSNRCVFIPRRSAQEYFNPSGKMYAVGSCGSGVFKSRLKPPFRGPGGK